MACKLTAIVKYYSLLSTFAWLLLIVFKAWKEQRPSVTYLRIASSQSRRYALILYPVIGWLVFPLIPFSAALLMEYQQDEHTIRPRLVTQCISEFPLLLERVITQSLQLLAQVKLASLGWYGTSRQSALRWVCFRSQSGGEVSVLLLTYQLLSCYWGRRTVSFVRLALTVVMQFVGDFLGVILLYSLGLDVSFTLFKIWSHKRGTEV